MITIATRGFILRTTRTLSGYSMQEKTERNPKGAGRPAGAKNKDTGPKYLEALMKADGLSKAAVDFLRDVLKGDVKGATVATRFNAAVKILGLSEEYAESIADKINKSPEKTKEDTQSQPLISLKAPTEERQTH